MEGSGGKNLSLTNISAIQSNSERSDFQDKFDPEHEAFMNMGGNQN
jgi:hypothetical protein